MSIQDKYTQSRPFIKNGQLILFRGTGLLAKAIQYFDEAYYNHIGIVWEANGRLFILDSNAAGVHPDFLSDRINEYADFCLIELTKTPEDISAKLNQIMDKGQAGIKYNFGRLFQIAIYKKLGWDIKRLDGGGKRDICSQFAQQYTNLFPIACYAKDNLITPQGFIRATDRNEAVILVDTSGQ